MRDWYRVTKTIRNRYYDYWQRTERHGRSVKTFNKYIGPAGSGSKSSASPSIIKLPGALAAEGRKHASAEEFVNSLKYISSGSDRDVYTLTPDKVIKVAKNPRGVQQNALAADKFAQDNGLIPKTFENAVDYVVSEFVGKPDANTTEMIRELNQVDVTRLVGKVGGPDAHEAAIKTATTILNRYGYNAAALLRYTPQWTDLMELDNLGQPQKRQTSSCR
jgi:hypothetical protein